MGEPTSQHEERRLLLRSIATLGGFSVPFSLPNGMIPDVSQLSLDTGAVFIGEAKHSEQAWNLSTLGRLERYMWWLAQKRPINSHNIFCICHPKIAGKEWLNALELLSGVTGVLIGRTDVMDLSYDTAVSWVTCIGSKLAFRPVGQRDLTPHIEQDGKRALHIARP